MADQLSDPDILHQIQGLIAEEAALHADATAGQQERLHALDVQLEQCWDLLRQRRARREFGQNPNEAHTRPASVVEDYEG